MNAAWDLFSGLYAWRVFDPPVSFVAHSAKVILGHQTRARNNQQDVPVQVLPSAQESGLVSTHILGPSAHRD